MTSAGTEGETAHRPNRATPLSIRSLGITSPGRRGGVTTTARRDFITRTGHTLAGATAVAILDVPSVIAQPKVQWRMTTAWPTTLDMLHGAAQKLAKVVDEMSGGRFKIEIFPGGQLMSIFECFDGASRGTVEALMGTPT